LIAVDYDRLMDGAKADLVISYPPYNVVIDGYTSGLGKLRHREFSMASGEMNSAEFTNFFRKAMIAAREHNATGSLAYYFMDWRHMNEIFVCWAGSLYRASEPMRLGEKQRRYEELLSERP
jgi:hypothetical protein